MTSDARSELVALRERAKELGCLYRVNEAVADRMLAPHEVFQRVLEAIPAGWQHPESTGGCIVYLGRHYEGPGFSSSGMRLGAPLRLWRAHLGSIEVTDTHPFARNDEPFLPEERQLLDSIAARLGEYLEWKHQQLVGEPIGSAAEHWRWRQRFAERLAVALDRTRFGVRRMFLTGSTERGEAGPSSDIDLVVVFGGNAAQRHDLELWLEGWSLCLAEVARQHSGSCSQSGLLNVSWLEHDPDPRRLDLREL